MNNPFESPLTGELNDELLAELQRAHFSRESQAWPFLEFNEQLGSLAPGTLTVITGHPGAGKSTLLRNLVLYAASDGDAELLVARRSPDTERLLIMCSALGIRVDAAFRNKDSHATEAGASTNPVTLQGNVKVNEFSARRLAELELLGLDEFTEDPESKECDLFCVDDVDCVGGVNRGAIADNPILVETLSMLRSIADNASIPVVVTLADQIVNVPNSPHPEHRDKISRRENFAPWEQIPDTIIELHRPDAVNPNHERAGELDAYVVKSELRPTPAHLTTLAHLLHRARICDLSGEAK